MEKTFLRKIYQNIFELEGEILQNKTFIKNHGKEYTSESEKLYISKLELVNEMNEKFILILENLIP